MAGRGGSPLRPAGPPALGPPAGARGDRRPMSVGIEPARFDPCAPVPAGVTVLEASAGTGKTHAITAIATRLVALGTPLEDLLLVTFTRMATGELRDRVRGHLVRTEAALARA